MARFSRVGMQELDQKLSRIVEAARISPVSVFRYGSPWVWIVSQEEWQKTLVDIRDYLPIEHPLINLKERLGDARLSASIESCFAECGNGIDAEALVCSMVLWLSTKCAEDEQDLYNQINYNLLYRWFVGLDIHRRAWPKDVFVAGIKMMKENRMAMAQIESFVHRDPKEMALKIIQ